MIVAIWQHTIDVSIFQFIILCLTFPKFLNWDNFLLNALSSALPKKGHDYECKNTKTITKNKTSGIILREF